MKTSKALIEHNNFPFEFISKIAEKESWRKELNRPIYHLHKWWAKRLGSVFRAILLGCVLPEDADLLCEFYKKHSFPDKVIFEPFMGSGTTIGEAAKIGMTSIGCDINPVAAEAVKVALTPFDEKEIFDAFQDLTSAISSHLLDPYKSTNSKGEDCDVLYYFWVMQSECKSCHSKTDLFSDFILAQNAYPSKKPKIHVICPHCNNIFEENYNNKETKCPGCHNQFNFRETTVKGARFKCRSCGSENVIADAFRTSKPTYRIYAKLVLNGDGSKEYLQINENDLQKYQECSAQLEELITKNQIAIPDLMLDEGHNTQQAINYGFKNWRDFFNDRQLLLLAKLHKAILEIKNEDIRQIFLLIFSSCLEFNNMFASYKGEGTGAVRHMFSNHVLKPERVPIEANIWGTNKSSGSFSGIFKSRINRILSYKKNPKEVCLDGEHEANYSLTNLNVERWRGGNIKLDGSVYLECGNSASLSINNSSVDFVVTDPPFFDNVHYSELADFFYSWLKLNPFGFIGTGLTTRNANEVQDKNAALFSSKLEAVFKECNRVLKDEGLLIFSYHHSRKEGWVSISSAIKNAGFIVVNCHPIKSDMSVATPKQQAKEPIQLDILIVCRKGEHRSIIASPYEDIILQTQSKIDRLVKQGFALSKNDKKIILYGEMLKWNFFTDEKELLDLEKMFNLSSFLAA